MQCKSVYQVCSAMCLALGGEPGVPGHIPGGVRAAEHDEKYRGRQLHPGGRECPAGCYRRGGKFFSRKSHVLLVQYL